MTGSRRARAYLEGYAAGAFPMASGRREAISWYSPDPRAILPLEAFHVPRRLARTVRSERYEVRWDTAFERVVAGCADRRETWISRELEQVYRELFFAGHAHSVEAWREGALAGGLLGVAVGAAFVAESKFHRERDASKVSLVRLVERLARGGCRLLDVQYLTPHLARFGAIAIPRAEFLERLRVARGGPDCWVQGGAGEVAGGDSPKKRA